MASVAHVVQFKFNSDLTEESIREICGKMLALQQNCIHPVTGKPYITSARGGKENSVDQLHHGYTHVFIVEFDSVEDRDYYALKDPYHLEFAKYMGTVVKETQVVDFTEDAF